MSKGLIKIIATALSVTFAIAFFTLRNVKSSEPSLTPSPVASQDAIALAKWCTDVQKSIDHFKWKIDACKDLNWKIGATSVEGRPIVFADFGDEKAANTTLILSTVHGDEVTPLYVGIQIAHWIHDHDKDLKNARIIVAPLLNPDGYFHVPQHRTNAHKVDVNRNFATKDWQAAALRSWKMKFRSDPRRYPGNEPHSEPETVFQEELIQKIKPQKILSIHSPLNHLDYDGPSALSLNRFSEDYVQECLKLRQRLKATTTGFFPGSLGNYAGQELGIPTLTLELPTANAGMADAYWKKFREGIDLMIKFEVPPLNPAAAVTPLKE
jgi:protein MpaA